MRDESIIEGQYYVKPALAAAYLGITEEQVWLLVDQGALPIIKVNTRSKSWCIGVDHLRNYHEPVYDAPPLVAIVPSGSAPTDDGYWPAVELTLKSPAGVYVLQSDRYFKIGYSSRPFTRVMDLAGSTPHPIRVIAYMQHKHAIELEYALHTKFARKRMNGEWFRLDEDEVRYLCRLADRMALCRLLHSAPRAYKWSDNGQVFASALDAVEYLASL